MSAITTNNEMPSSLMELLAQLDKDGIHDHRRYSAVRSFLNFRARDTGTPLSGAFELTPLCNLDCKMCYVHLSADQLSGARLLSADQWEDIMSQAIDSGMMYAKLTGGECLAYPDFRRLYLFLRNRGIETGILTNGTLLDRDMADFLRENPPSSIQITLYGASEDAYERVTGRRAFAAVMENIRRLLEYGLPLSISVTPNAFMTDGEDILRLIHSLGLAPQVNCGLLAPREDTGRTMADAELDTYIDLFKLNRSLLGVAFTDTCDEASLPHTGGEGEASLYGVPCGAGRSGFSIGWDGRMRPCNTFPQISENVLELGFAEAWHRVNKQANHFPQPVECVQCSYKDPCRCCLSEHASGAPLGHANPRVCARTKRMVAQGLLSI